MRAVGARLCYHTRMRFAELALLVFAAGCPHGDTPRPSGPSPTVAEVVDRLSRAKDELRSFTGEAVTFDGVSGAGSTVIPSQVDTTSSFSVGTWVSLGGDDDDSGIAVSLLGEQVAAFSLGSDGDRFPKSWLFHYRWDRGVPTARGEMLRHATIGGRTTAWAPAVQK